MNELIKVAEKTETKKVILLNSGGFDSACLSAYLYANLDEDTEIHSLHFTYGALNEEQQQNCVTNLCDRFGFINKTIELPKFTWTTGAFYDPTTNEHQTQYLEYRNLVFLSYALSYAESIGAKEIYLATLSDGQYSDTNEIFIRGVNSFTEHNSGISVITPFSDRTKWDLLGIAIFANYDETDFFSCDTPKEDGSPCGECEDCLVIKELLEELTIDKPIKEFIQSDGEITETFKQLMKEGNIEEVRALINNDCQLKCSHCFYGFDNMKREALPKEKYFEVLKSFVEDYGVKNIHFSGKEPLFNDDILWYAKKVSELDCTFNLVTNGINVPKYAKDLKKYGIEKIFLSVDDIENTNGVRSVKNVTDKALKACAKEGIPVEVFIDLHQNNYDKIEDIVFYLCRNYTLKKIYVRTIRSIGNAKDLKPLTSEQIDVAWKTLKEVAPMFPRKEFEMSISIEYVQGLYDEETEVFDDIASCESLYTTAYDDNLSLYAEEFCQRYYSQITLTPDGFLLGCASEVSLPNYDKISVGNVSDYSLDTLLEKAHIECSKCNDCWGDKKLACVCSFLE